jgi:hypothetical protein
MKNFYCGFCATQTKADFLIITKVKKSKACPDNGADSNILPLCMQHYTDERDYLLADISQNNRLQNIQFYEFVGKSREGLKFLDSKQSRFK